MSLPAIVLVVTVIALAAAALWARLTRRRMVPALVWTYVVALLLGVAVLLMGDGAAGPVGPDVLGRRAGQILNALTVAGLYGTWCWWRRRRAAAPLVAVRAAVHAAGVRTAEEMDPTRIEAFAEKGSADWAKYFDDLGAVAARENLVAVRAAAHAAGVGAFEEMAPTRIEAFAVKGDGDWAKYFDDLGAFAAREALATEDAVVVERAMHSNANDVFWAAGTNPLATELQ